MINNQSGGFLTLQKDNVTSSRVESIVTIPNIHRASV